MAWRLLREWQGAEFFTANRNAMDGLQALKRLTGQGDERNLAERDATALMAAMLDGGFEALELGALLALLERKPLTVSELFGYCGALAQRCNQLRPPGGRARPVVFACYQGMRSRPHLLPLVALTLQRLGVPVLVYGALDGGGGVAAAQVFREFGVFPATTLARAQSRLDEHRLAFVPTAVLAPGVADLLALRGRLGFGGFVQAIARLLAPFGAGSLQVVAANAVTTRALLREYLSASGGRALLLDGIEDEPLADPLRRPRLEYLAGDDCRVLFDAESVAFRHAGALPQADDAPAVAGWCRRVLSGELSLPLPLVNQIACCLYGAGYADDINQAKAIVAIETGSLAAA
jgi:anthranilate phosphoribosyltransferase